MGQWKVQTKEPSGLVITRGQPLELDKFYLPGEDLLTISGSFGKMQSFHFSSQGYELWYHKFDILRRATLFFEHPGPLLLFHAKLTHPFALHFTGLEALDPKSQYQFVHLPQLNSEVLFPEPLCYESFSVHFEKEALQPYAKLCPLLEIFLQNLAGGKQALFTQARFLIPSMYESIRAMLECKFPLELALHFLDHRVHELLLEIIYRASLSDRPEPHPLDKRKAAEVKRIILSDLSRYESVEVLARKVGTTEARLQQAFKQIYGTTVGKFSREERLKKAHQVLATQRETLLSIALMFGYNDPGNFSTAFKQFFGYPPGRIYKSTRQ